MINSNNFASLHIALSSEPDTLWAEFPLTHDVNYLGRPEPHEQGPAFFDFEADNVRRAWTARHSVRIFRNEQGEYILENWSNRLNIRLYERSLGPGQTWPLQHSYQFQVPEPIGPTDPYFPITFIINKFTMPLRAFRLGPDSRKVFIFGKEIKPLLAQQYELLAYLYQYERKFRSYEVILAHVYAPSRAPEAIAKYLAEEIQAVDRHEYNYRKRQLHVLLTNVREKIKEASGGISLIETISDEGLRLMI